MQLQLQGLVCRWLVLIYERKGAVGGTASLHWSAVDVRPRAGIVVIATEEEGRGP